MRQFFTIVLLLLVYELNLLVESKKFEVKKLKEKF